MRVFNSCTVWCLPITERECGEPWLSHGDPCQGLQISTTCCSLLWQGGGHLANGIVHLFFSDYSDPVRALTPRSAKAALRLSQEAVLMVFNPKYFVHYPTIEHEWRPHSTESTCTWLQPPQVNIRAWSDDRAARGNYWAVWKGMTCFCGERPRKASWLFQHVNRATAGNPEPSWLREAPSLVPENSGRGRRRCVQHPNTYSPLLPNHNRDLLQRLKGTLPSLKIRCE